ncbi:hypothetical protein LX32DRAFT_1804 [Colletotrichum zoysiae]|uniref:Uncharacterized protein n=1 Tax=Colletotrichum zoysiae TaxID=1216348 RepID=A0AAD9M5M1_9PEZI|nr:hypothetical protein LX32DRAFT_1804 [Colletotrichum zoysiae]
MDARVSQVGNRCVAGEKLPSLASDPKIAPSGWACLRIDQSSEAASESGQACFDPCRLEAPGLNPAPKAKVFILDQRHGGLGYRVGISAVPHIGNQRSGSTSELGTSSRSRYGPRAIYLSVEMGGGGGCITPCPHPHALYSPMRRTPAGSSLAPPWT